MKKTGSFIALVETKENKFVNDIFKNGGTGSIGVLATSKRNLTKSKNRNPKNRNLIKLGNSKVIKEINSSLLKLKKLLTA